MTRRAIATVLVLVVAGCGDHSPPSPVLPVARSYADETTLRRAAEALWKAVDDYDAKAFAALSVAPSIERKGDGPSPADVAKAFEGTVKDLHQKYGARSRVLTVEPKGAGNDDSGVVNAVMGDAEDAIALTFTRVAGVWKLSLISSADPAALTPAREAPPH